MRILMALMGDPKSISGGAIITSLQNAKLLQEASHTVQLVHPGDEDLSHEIEGIPAIQIKSPNIYWNYREPHPAWQKLIWHGLENYNPLAEFALKKVMKDFAPDVYFTISIENTNGASWRAAESLNIPSVHMPVSTYMICRTSSMMKNDEPCKGQCTNCKLISTGKKLLSQYPSGLIGESGFIIKAHQSRGYFKNAASIVLPTAFETNTNTKAVKRESNSKLRVGFLGELSALKAPDLLAKASHELADKNVEFHLGGVGKDKFANKLKADFAKDSAKFWGWVKPSEFLKEIDLLVLPSRGSEVFGRVLIEAYSNGIPVIGSDQGGIPENIDEGQTGFVFKTNDWRELAQQIAKLADDHELFNQMAENAFKKSHDFGAAQWTDQMNNFLDKVVQDYLVKA